MNKVFIFLAAIILISSCTATRYVEPLEKNKQDPYTFKSIQEDEDDKLLEKLKDKNLSEEDLKKLYEDLKNKKE